MVIQSKVVKWQADLRCCPERYQSYEIFEDCPNHPYVYSMSPSKIIWLLNSRAYKKAKKLVSATLDNPYKLVDLVKQAQFKSSANISAKITEIIKPVNALFRLLKAYAAGEYRDISFESLALIVASVIYFVMPIDVIPDFILALGHADDAALLAWTIRSVSTDLERFLIWEKKRPIDVRIEK